jgi:hypothetical protein
VTLEPGETQILTGPGLTVTDRRIECAQGEIRVADIQAPLLEATTIRISAGPVLIMIGLVFFALGIWFVGPMLWISGAALVAFGRFARINRPAFALTVERGGARQGLYTTAREADAKLAMAALVEALRRRDA